MFIHEFSLLNGFIFMCVRMILCEIYIGRLDIVSADLSDSKNLTLKNFNFLMKILLGFELEFLFFTIRGSCVSNLIMTNFHKELSQKALQIATLQHR